MIFIIYSSSFIKMQPKGVKDRNFFGGIKHFETGIYMNSLKNFREEDNDKLNTRIPLSGNGVSTFLIPKKLMKGYSERLKQFKSKGDYFSYLLSRFRTMLSYYIAHPSGLKTQYQIPHQNLHKENLRVKEVDWAELTVFSASTGMSRCLLFVSFLQMDLQGWDSLLKKIGIPYNHPFSPQKVWELLATIGLDREGAIFFRGFYPRRL